MSFNSDSNANKFKKSYFNGFVDTNSDVIARNKIISNNLISLSGSIYIGTDTNTSNIYIGNSSSNIFLDGNTTNVETQNLEVNDKLIRLNKNGINSSNSGIEIEENGNISSYIKISDDKFNYKIKYPNDGNAYDMITRKNLESNISSIDHHIILDGGCQQDYIIGGSLNIGGRLTTPSIYCNHIFSNDNFNKLCAVLITNTIQIPIYKSLLDTSSKIYTNLNLNSIVLNQTVKMFLYPYVKLKLNFGTIEKIFFNTKDDLYYDEIYINLNIVSLFVYYKNNFII